MRYTIYHIIIGMLAVLLVCGACQDDLEGNPLNSNMLTLQLQTSAITRALEVGEDRFNENVGLSLSIQIFSNRQNRTATNKARIAAASSRLDQQDLLKTLLREVETAYLDAVSAQSQYVAANEKERYARQSYELTDEQFRVGMKNTVELITAQNEWSAAQQEVLQAKYMALLNMELLNIYQGQPVTTY